MEVNGIQITENPRHCPQMNSMIMFGAHGRASPDSSRWGPNCLIIRIKGSEEGFVPVLASLGIQKKTFSTTERSAKKKGCFCACVFCLPSFPVPAWEAACWHSQHLTPATTDTIWIVLALLSKALLIMNQPQVAAMSIPARVCHGFWLHDVNVEPSSGKTILFYCTGTRLC